MSPLDRPARMGVFPYRAPPGSGGRTKPRREAERVRGHLSALSALRHLAPARVPGDVLELEEGA